MKLHFYNIYKCFIFLIWSISALGYERKDDTLILNVMELLDLVAKEKGNTTSFTTSRTHSTNKNVLDKRLIDSEELEMPTAKNWQDKDALMMRKVWSRWSKWSACSVTCGDGAIFRKRVCVSGRCAPGEREEQRRACTRSPCELPNIPEDLRDSE